MAIIERTYGKESNVVIDEVLISSDHMSLSRRGFGKNSYPKSFRTAPRDYSRRKATEEQASPVAGNGPVP